MIKTGIIKNTTRNYSQGAWQGVNYELGLDCKKIAKLIRKELKQLYPSYKFSVTSKYNHLSVYMIQAPIQPFENDENIDYKLLEMQSNHLTAKELQIQLDNYRTGVYSGYSVNQYHIENSYMLTTKSKEIFAKINELLNSFNYDDSDIQTDYFSTKFYVDLGIGKWDKSLIII